MGYKGLIPLQFFCAAYNGLYTKDISQMMYYFCSFNSTWEFVAKCEYKICKLNNAIR